MIMAHKRLFILLVFSLLVLGIIPLLGLSLNAPQDIQLLIELRLPRVLLAFSAGAGLAMCGLVFQTLFHNALATPFTLGVASGASLGAALYVASGVQFVLLGIHGSTLAAFLGALLAVFMVYFLNRNRPYHTLLLTGVALNFIFSSLILSLQYLSNLTDSFRIMRWLMGSLNTVGYADLFQLLPFVILCAIVLLWRRSELNLLSLGDNLAHSRGISLKTSRYLLLGITSLCTAAIVALCGPIGFVGMMAPHICRLLIGQDHHLLIPASILFGGSFLVLCDALSRTLLAPTILPVGIITTLLGGPFFLWLLFRHK